MQFRLISGFLIFIGSYLPLAIILAVQDIPVTWWSRDLCSWTEFKAESCSYIPFANPKYSIAFICIAILAVFLANLSFRKLSYPFRVEVIQVKSIPNELINYTFPYVVSFMGISYSEPQKMLGFLVFLVWMFAITYRSGQILMNPLLLMYKWRLYEVTILIGGHSREVRVLKQGTLIPGPQQGQTVQDFYILKD
ncbi:hypothetical protein [Massilia niastensis]|uniref:hypothetical protein n=1 Tax=Massilia niastensis TaxID=544911 RepID=UPI000684267C|nr:hypothetical protein [Massilia niastensis]